MNREQALEWLVENVAKWPVNYKNAVCMLDGWWWSNAGDVFFVSDDFSMVITQADWLQQLTI